MTSTQCQVHESRYLSYQDLVLALSFQDCHSAGGPEFLRMYSSTTYLIESADRLSTHYVHIEVSEIVIVT